MQCREADDALAARQVALPVLGGDGDAGEFGVGHAAVVDVDVIHVARQ